MTKEQKAIEILTKKVDSWKCKRPRNSIILKRLIDEIDTENNAIETVLSILKEKDKEIEKKDRIIDLMAEHIAFCKNINSYEDIKTYKKQIKQYFERKVKNGQRKNRRRIKGYKI